jgi:hypothetical protein
LPMGVVSPSFVGLVVVFAATARAVARPSFEPAVAAEPPFDPPPPPPATTAITIAATIAAPSTRNGALLRVGFLSWTWADMAFSSCLLIDVKRAAQAARVRVFRR